MRSFISLNIDLKSKEKIQKIQNLVKEKIEKPYLARFEKPENFHLTIFFVGEVDEIKLTKIYETVVTKIENKFGQLNFECSGINAFPNLKNPKVIFLNCKDSENKIFELAEEVKTILGEFGFTQDKNFHPHITLARIKGRTKLKDISDINLKVNFSVNKLSIMQSIISTTGAEHKEIFAINL
ncbi:MAG: RNA 2',3'-cyclic phosphodiesterase [Bacteroidetes bacterium]|nr:RNA 2',3'-cyclic phosphodiesterase [Bacteroidota bacterium]